MGLRREKKAAPQVAPIEMAKLENIYSLPSPKDFNSMWEGHRSQLEEKRPIYLQVGGNGGSYKFTYVMTSDYQGKDMLVYGHVHSNYPPVGVILHAHVPEMIVKKEISFSDDDKVAAVEWQYCMSGRYLTSKFWFRDVSWLYAYIVCDL